MSEGFRPRFPRRILLFIGIGLAVFLVYLYYFIGTVGIVDVLRHTNFFWYTLAFVAFLANVLFYALAWQSMLRNLNINAKIREVLLFAWAGLFFDSTVPDPGWSGDLSKAYMMSKASGQEPGKVVASVVSQKIIVTVLTIGELILGISLLASNYAFSSDVLIFVTAVLLLTISSLVVIVYLSTNEKVTGRILGSLIRAACFICRGRWNPENFRVRAQQLLSRFHQGIRTLYANPKRLAKPILFSLLAVGFDISVIFLTFISLGYPVSADKVLIVYALTGTLQAMGVSFLGFTEIVMSGSYSILNIPATISVSATLLIRVVTLWFKLIVSYFVFQRAGIGLLLGKGQETKKESTIKR